MPAAIGRNRPGVRQPNARRSAADNSGSVPRWPRKCFRYQSAPTLSNLSPWRNRASSMRFYRASRHGSTQRRRSQGLHARVAAVSGQWSVVSGCRAAGWHWLCQCGRACSRAFPGPTRSSRTLAEPVPPNRFRRIDPQAMYHGRVSDAQPHRGECRPKSPPSTDYDSAR